MTEKTLFPMNVYLRNEQELAEFAREHSAQPQGEREAFEAWRKRNRFGTPEEAWVARASLSASPAQPRGEREAVVSMEPIGWIHPQAMRDLAAGRELSIPLVARSEANLEEGGDVPVYVASPAACKGAPGECRYFGACMYACGGTHPAESLSESERDAVRNKATTRKRVPPPADNKENGNGR